MRLNSLIFHCVGSLILAAYCEGKPPGTDEATQAYAWFDGLGFPHLTKCKLVRVATGGSVEEQGKAPRNSYLQGFLVTDDGKVFTILTATLQPYTFTRTGPDKPEHEKVGYEPLDLEKAMVDLLKALRRPKDEDGWSRRFGERLSEPAELFVLASACAAQRHPKLAEELLDEAKRIVSERRHRDNGFFQVIVDDIANSEMWQAVEAFGDTNVPRKHLLNRFRLIAKNFSRTRHATQAKANADILEKMVAEDDAYARKPKKPEKEMTVKERTADLIFRLRDQNGRQFSQPGHCDIFAGDWLAKEGAPKSPAVQLVEIGY